MAATKAEGLRRPNQEQEFAVSVEVTLYASDIQAAVDTVLNRLSDKGAAL